jgi:uncharacterized protein YkwD
MGGDGNDEDGPEHLFTLLMHSEGHRENILRGEFEEVGVGARSGTYQEYDDTSTIYTTVFGGVSRREDRGTRYLESVAQIG